LGNGVNGAVEALVSYGGSLVIGGRFTTAGGSAASYIAQWNGTAWSKFGTTTTDLDNNVYAMLSTGSRIYVGGFFTMAGGTTVNHIAKWDGTKWNAVGLGTDGEYVQGFALSGSTLYVLGAFNVSGLITLNNAAAVDKSTNVWSALGSGTDVGTNNQVWISTAANGTLYAAGFFSTAGGMTSLGVASWNGSSWSVLGEPSDALNGTIRSLAQVGTDIYVGGTFTRAGMQKANNIAVFNTNTGFWSPLGSGSSNGVDGPVYSLAVLGNDVYVGGNFTHAGGTQPDGVNGPVHSLAANADTVFAGGAFSTAGGSVANNLVKWDGHTWTAVGAGVNSVASALALSDTSLLIGRYFTTSGLITSNGITLWSFALGTFTNLGDGVNGTISAVLQSGQEIYVGGSFTTAGKKPSYDFAHYSPNGLTEVNVEQRFAKSFNLFQNYPNPFNPTTAIDYRLPENGRVTITLYDVLGRSVMTLVNGYQQAGAHRTILDGSNLASGVYFYRLSAGSFVQTKKLMLLK
jgi:hypothetical protein